MNNIWLYLIWKIKRITAILTFQNNKHKPFAKLFNSYKMGQIVLIKKQKDKKIMLVQMFNINGKTHNAYIKYENTPEGIKKREKDFNNFSLAKFEYIMDVLEEME